MRVSILFGRGHPLSPPSQFCFESRFFVLAEWRCNPPTPRTLSSPLENTESLCGSLCCVTRLRSRMTRTRERGGVKGKFSRGNYRKHLEEFRVSFKFTTGSVRHTPPQSTESAESRNLRKLSNGGTVLEIRSPKKSSALCVFMDSVSFPSNGPPPFRPSLFVVTFLCCLFNLGLFANCKYFRGGICKKEEEFSSIYSASTL